VIPVVSCVGKSRSGKTILLEKVVRELKSRGYRVATVKHTHPDFDIDQPGKDTWRLAQAESDIVAISSPSKMAVIEHLDEEITLSQIAGLFLGKADIVLAEGYKNANLAKVLVLDAGRSQGDLCGQGKILTTITACLSSEGRPQFLDEEVAHILNLLIARINTHSLKARDV